MNFKKKILCGQCEEHYKKVDTHWRCPKCSKAVSEAWLAEFISRRVEVDRRDQITVSKLIENDLDQVVIAGEYVFTANFKRNLPSMWFKEGNINYGETPA